jgi:hypothetical protein
MARAHWALQSASSRPRDLVVREEQKEDSLRDKTFLERGRCPVSNLFKPQLKQLELDVGLDWARPKFLFQKDRIDQNCFSDCGRKYG